MLTLWIRIINQASESCRTILVTCSFWVHSKLIVTSACVADNICGWWTASCRTHSFLGGPPDRWCMSMMMRRTLKASLSASTWARLLAVRKRSRRDEPCLRLTNTVLLEKSSIMCTYVCYSDALYLFCRASLRQKDKRHIFMMMLQAGPYRSTCMGRACMLMTAIYCL